MISLLKKNNYSFLLIVLGLLIIGYAIFIYSVAPYLTYESHPSSSSVRLYSIVRILVGIIYTASIILIIKKRLLSTKNIAHVFIIGLIARLILIPTEPILEDDFNRYLWDGAVVANGYNPYEFAPKQFLETDSLTSKEPTILYDVANSSGVIIERINHPHIRTIYPPVAQGIFAISYFVKPWNVPVWKSILLLIDLIVFYLIILVLKELKKPLILATIYWWNPILLHEIFNSGHMDLIMYPFILLGILFLLRNKIISSVSFFAVAIGVKIWPIIFIPFVLKKAIKNRKLFIFSSWTATGIIIILILPIIITKLDNSLGFITYSKNWTNNESIFQLVNLMIKQFIALFNINYHCSLCIARWVTILFFGSLIGYFLIKKERNENDSIQIFYYLVAIIFLISPTQFPWYYTWVLPLLVFTPRISFVAYAMLLPLYQLKYSTPFLVWVEHLPIIILFTIELINPRVRQLLEVKKNQNLI